MHTHGQWKDFWRSRLGKNKLGENMRVLLTGGIGDIFAIESHADFTEVKEILWATRVAHTVIPLFASAPEYQHIQHTVIWSDFSTRFDFIKQSDLHHALNGSGKSKETKLLVGCFDWSISQVFPKIFSGVLKFRGSRFLQINTDVSKFQLPNKYTVVCPASTDKRDKKRDFNEMDWRHVNVSPVVVLNTGNDPVPEWAIDLSNKTTLCESIQILKNATGYVGIDSCLACLACQIFPPEKTTIKSVNPHYRKHFQAYCAPIPRIVDEI